MMQSGIPSQCCPYCGYKVDRCASVGSTAQPKPGDVSLCFQCMEVAFFDDSLQLRRPLQVELENLKRSPEWDLILRARAAKNYVKAERN